MTRDYELAFILNPEVSEEGTRAVLERVEQIVANYGGQIVKVNQWGRRRLAYPIERHRDGFYIFIDMILTPETVIELERMLKVSEVVLRHMVKKRDAKAVQKEREAHAAAAAAAEEKAAAEAREQAAAEAQEQVSAPAEATEEVPAEASAESATEAAPETETEAPSASSSETENVPSAVEQSVEA
ncbi:30S ribosomal protein S6 [Ktedonosporobacter rubrisoli]|uniref:Small ribosomal subunit protein bS6 n=1 Tax=Ktedonosporobacter rubrisoli TaxID=2509675 RepID=A0A4P6JWP9_KTERU|nr:30S ribosomal protein S6 [Ktedonosporobacter rubrisoli]QBD80129.1 30S ribosomal protein S6 [Ktedonosporobacter rubrisoli]